MKLDEIFETRISRIDTGETTAEPPLRLVGPTPPACLVLR